MVTLNYSVSLESAVTRAESENQGSTKSPDGTAEYGKAEMISKVRCLVYSVAADGTLTEFYTEEKDYSAQLQFNPSFFKNQSYKIAFVAYNPDAYNIEGELITYKTPFAENPECYDLYVYAADVDFNNLQTTADLARVVALWKVYTTDSDIEATTAHGSTITKASVTAEVNTSYNIFTGVASDRRAMTFKRAFPDDDSQTFGEDSERYTLISAQYIFPSDAVTVGLKTYSIQNDTDIDNSSIEIPNVPTGANVKINIYGRIATVQSSFTVTLDLESDGSENHPVGN